MAMSTTTTRMKRRTGVLKVFNVDPDPNPKQVSSEIMIGMILQSYGQDKEEESETDAEI